MSAIDRWALAATLLFGCESPPRAELKSTEAGVVQSPSPASSDGAAGAHEPPFTPLAKPPSRFQVANVSLSVIGGEALVAALREAGVGNQTATLSQQTLGLYESISVPLVQGSLKGVLQIVRPALVPGLATGREPSALMAQAEQVKSRPSAAYYQEPEAAVLVSVQLTEGGDTKAAKKLLDQIVTGHPALKPAPGR